MGDGERFELKREYAMMSKLVKNICEGDASMTNIFVKNVDGNILKLIVKYMEHHQGKDVTNIEWPLKSDKLAEILEDEWDVEFINNMDKKTLFSAIVGANYMGIKGLLYRGVAKVAILNNGKLPEKLKQILGGDLEQILGKGRRLFIVV